VDEPFLDTNVLVYAMSQDEGRSGRAQRLLLAAGGVNVQVLNELVNVVRLKMHAT
jgi:predicted nucleic acid-binding protein